MKKCRPGSDCGPFFYFLTMVLSVLVVLGTSLFFTLHDQELIVEEHQISDLRDGQVQLQDLSGDGEFMLPPDTGNVVLVHKYSSAADPICDDCGLIRFLTIKDLSAPVTGQALDKSISFSASTGATYKVTWSPSDTTARASTIYTVTIDITPKSGYKFDSKTTASLNGESMRLTTLSGGAVRITKTFAKTSATTPVPVTVTPKPTVVTPKPTVVTPKPTVTKKPTPTKGPDIPVTPRPSTFPSPTKVPTLTPFPTITTTPTPTPTSTPTPTNTPVPTQKPTSAPTPTPSVPFVAMPDVHGMNYHDAKSLVTRELQDGGFKTVKVEIVWVACEDASKNFCVEDQDPKANTHLFLTDTSISVTLYVAKSGAEPTAAPTSAPTVAPTGSPVVSPTVAPTGTPTKTPTQAPKPGVTGTPTPTPDPNEPSFEDFVERLYVVALDRASEPEGKAFWVEKVENGEYNGADCARFFLLEAPEFMNRKLDDTRFLTVLYHTFYDRDPDAAGMSYWLGRLKTDATRETVVNDFIESTEWCNVCATYSVRSGAIYHKAEFASRKAIEFATRLYTCCLGREPEEDGLKYWSMALTNLEQTGYDAAKLFFTGDEFVNLKTTDKEFIERLYLTFMDREADEGGLKYWAGRLAAGETRENVMKGFASSEEFEKLCKSCGIERGEIEPKEEGNN